MGTGPHQVLVVTLTLFQPQGAGYAHPILINHQVLKATGAPNLYSKKLVTVEWNSLNYVSIFFFDPPTISA